jgi:hypothetical protein
MPSQKCERQALTGLSTPFCFDGSIDISESDIQEVSMPSGIPFVYKVRRLFIDIVLQFWKHDQCITLIQIMTIFIPSSIQMSIPYHLPRAKSHRLILLVSSWKSQDCLERHSSEASCGIAMCPDLSGKLSKLSNALVR